MNQIQPGDACEVLEGGDTMPSRIVMVMLIFPEQLMLADDEGYVRIDCEVADAAGTIWIGHTELLRKIEPPREDLQVVEWATVPAWQPVKEPA